jgi:hypothetical protein
MSTPLPDEELLNAVRRAAPVPPENLLRSWQPPVPVKPAPRRLRPWVAGIATAAICGATLAFLPGSLLHPTPTFAEVEDAVLQAKTVSWTERWTDSYAFYPSGRMKKLPGGSRRYWADLRIPAIANPGKHWRSVSREGRTYQIGSSGALRTYQVGSWSLLMELSPALGKPDAGQLRAEIVRSVVLSQSKTQGGEWRSKKETIQGREYLKLTRVVPGHPGPGTWRVESTEYSFWIDPATRHVVKRETRERNKSPYQSVEMVTTCDDFRYDETPPAGLFDVQPPDGLRYMYIPQPVRTIKPEDQQAMEDAVRKVQDAWNQGDADTYLSLWRFDHPSNGSSRAEQLAALRNPNRLRWRQGKFAPASVRISGIYTHREGDMFPPQNPVEFELGGWGLLKELGGFKIVKVPLLLQ